MAVSHCGLHLGTGQVVQADADAGVGLAESGQVGRQAFGDRAGIGGDAQVALDAARELHHLALQRMQRCVQAANVAHQRPAGLGGLHATGAAVEQRHAEP